MRESLQSLRRDMEAIVTMVKSARTLIIDTDPDVALDRQAILDALASAKWR